MIRTIIKAAVFLAVIAVYVVLLYDTVTAEDGMYVLCRPGSVVNVRERPGKDTPVVGWVEFGRHVQTDGKRKAGYIHVVDLAAEVPEGWISAGYLVGDRPIEETYTALVASRYNVIARKCVGGKKIRLLRNGKAVTVYARSAEWCVTNQGFIMREWLERVD